MVDEAIRVSKTVMINMANSGPYLAADDLRSWARNKGVMIGETSLRYPHFGGGYRIEPVLIFSRKPIEVEEWKPSLSRES